MFTKNRQKLSEMGRGDPPRAHTLGKWRHGVLDHFKNIMLTSRGLKNQQKNKSMPKLPQGKPAFLFSTQIVENTIISGSVVAEQARIFQPIGPRVARLP